MTFQERAQTLKSDEKGAKWDMGGPKEEKSDKVVTVTLWPSVLSVDDGKKNTIYDFSRRKIDILDAAHKTYEEYSLYFEIGYREAEFSNRLFMKDALKAGGQVPPEFQPFQLEILFGLLNRKEKTPGAEAKKTGLDAWDYSAPGGEKVTRCEFGAEKVPDGLMATWAHFLLYGCSLHPSVMALLEKDGRFPKVLWYQNRNLGEVRQAGLTLIKQEQVPDPEDSWRKNFKLQGDSNPELWKLTQKAAAQTPPEIADSQKATQDFVDKAVRQQRFFDAALACLECSLQTGVKMDATLKTLVPRLKDDPNMQAFQVGLNTRSKGDAEEAIQALQSIDRKSLTKGYIIDIMLGDAYEVDDKYQEAIESYFKTLRSNPLMAGPWKDLGDVYYDMYEMDLAWLCWDTARHLYPNHPLLQAVTEEEKSLVKDYPEYF